MEIRSDLCQARRAADVKAIHEARRRDGHRAMRSSLEKLKN